MYCNDSDSDDSKDDILVLLMYSHPKSVILNKQIYFNQKVSNEDSASFSVPKESTKETKDEQETRKLLINAEQVHFTNRGLEFNTIINTGMIHRIFWCC